MEFKYLDFYFQKSKERKKYFNPSSYSYDSEKFIDRLSVSEFIAMYTKIIDLIMFDYIDIKINKLGVKIYIDYIKSLKAEWLSNYYYVIDKMVDIIYNKKYEEYMKYRLLYLKIIDIYLKKYGKYKVIK